MNIKRGDVHIMCCDLCHDPLTYRRINGKQNYEGYGFTVCSACCADTSLAADDICKAAALLTFHERTKHLGEIVPLFWPRDTNGNPISPWYIKKILTHTK